MVLGLLASAVVRAADGTQQQVANLAKVRRLAVLVAILTFHPRLPCRHMLCLNYIHQGVVEWQRLHGRGACSTASWAGNAPALCAFLLRPSLQTESAVGVEAWENARRARLGRLVRLLARRTADGIARKENVLFAACFCRT